MQTWSIMYTADKHKTKNRAWEEGTLDYNCTTLAGHFYSSGGELLGRIARLTPDRVVADATVSLFRHLVEVGQLVSEAPCSDALLAELSGDTMAVSTCTKSTDTGTGTGTGTDTGTELTRQRQPALKPVAPARSVLARPKVHSVVNAVEVQSMQVCDTLYTSDKQKKAKVWHDGVLKFYPSKKLAEFFDGQGVLMHKRVMTEIKTGEIVETAAHIIEITGDVPCVAPPALTALTALTAQSQTHGTAEHEIIYTTDKHKRAKKWIDGRLVFDPVTGNGLFYSEDKRLFYKRILSPALVHDGSEFESGQYMFQIGTAIDRDKEKVLMLEPVNVNVREDTEEDGEGSDEPTAKRSKGGLVSVIASDAAPLTGRSDTELLALLRKTAAGGQSVLPTAEGQTVHDSHQPSSLSSLSLDFGSSNHADFYGDHEQ